MNPKIISGLQRDGTHGLCASAAVLCQLGYEDPYFQGASLPVKGMKHEVDVKCGNTTFLHKDRYDHRSVNSNSSNYQYTRKFT